MNRRRAFILLAISIVILSGCVGNNPPETSMPSVPPAPKPTETLIPTITQTPTTPPTLSQLSNPDWDDRSVFLPGLCASAQEDLEGLATASYYQIAMTIPEVMDQPLLGEMMVRYFNTESVALNEIYFRLYPNFYGGSLTVSNVRVNEEVVEVQLESETTALRVFLPEALQPGESAILGMEFSLTLPQTMGGNYGLLGYFDEILVLDTFYPMIPAYDQEGWHSQFPAGMGDLTYQDASFYLVQVTAPEDLVLVYSGFQVDRTIANGWQKVTIAAGPARDFYLAGSAAFTVLSQEVDGIMVNSYAAGGLPERQRAALEVAARALDIFSQLYGEYPYREFDVISSPMMALGIEYPGITGVLLSLYEAEPNAGLDSRMLLETVVVHEVAHQWFYNLIGNDQQTLPWVDEALAQFATYQYYLNVYGDAGGEDYLMDWRTRWAMVDNAEKPVGLSAEAYQGHEYSAIVYGRGPLFLLEVEQTIGEDAFIAGLREYIKVNRWENADSQAIQTSLEAGCECDLSALFDEWVYGQE